MPFCPECGKPIEPTMKHCPNCGNPLKPSSQSSSGPSSQPTMPQPTERMYGAKNPGLAAFLSLIIPGGGQIYLGNVKRGVMILALVPCLALIMAGLWWFVLVNVFNIFGPIGLVIIFTPSIILNLWNVIDAYSQGKKYNTHIQQTGSPPW